MDLLWRLVANPKCGVYRRVRFYPNSKYRLGSSPRVKIENAQKADVAERQTRWFQVPVKRFVWVQIPSSAPTK